MIKGPDGIPRSLSHLDCCDDFSKQFLDLDQNREIIVLVHGCKGSSGRFNLLRNVFQSRGQQAICFNYDYRKSIKKSADQLIEALNELNRLVAPPRIILIGHSQGGLVARRALVNKKPDQQHALEGQNIRLVTISTPFNGIEASSHCGIKALHVLTGGITLLICQGIAGSTWSEINPRSNFINEPGTMYAGVYNHLKIVTDERDICRNYNSSGKCEKNDFVFSLDEQYKEIIDNDSRVTNVEMKAGHSLVVGTPGNPPYDLIEVLENYNVLMKNPLSSEGKQIDFMAQLYQY